MKDIAGNALASDFVWSFTTTGAAITLGLTTIGSSADSGDSNFLGSKFRTSAAGRIVSMSVWVGNVDTLAANRRYQLAIYTKRRATGTLVATSATGALVANAWNPRRQRVVTGKHRLLADVQHRRTKQLVNNMRYNSGAAGRAPIASGSVIQAWPTTFPAATIDNQVFSLFAVFGP